MKKLIIKNVRTVMPKRILEHHATIVEGGVISDVVPVERLNDSFCLDARIVDAAGAYLAPGFIDLHIHGAEGLLAESGKSALESICSKLPRYGVTGLLPAVCPSGSSKGDVILLGELSNAKSKGAEILGFFLEGHFLALTGAIPSHESDISLKQVRALIQAAGKYPVIFGISPELSGIADLLPEMTKHGAVPAFITHTRADFAQTFKAIAAGAVHATHFYNVFPYPGDKEPGVRGCGAVEAILASPGVSVDFIADGEHVDFAAIQTAIACKGLDHVCLITDANVNAGMPPGQYTGLGGVNIQVLYEGGPARNALDGTLAGSGLTMDLAVRNVMRKMKLTLPDAVQMASANPASVLGLKNKGKIAAGLDADMVLLDNEYRVVRTWVGGQTVFESEL